MTRLLDLQPIFARLTEACDHYQTSAPTVCEWANDLYIRIGEQPERVTLRELLFVERLVEDECWMQPNYAANALYHVQCALGQDVTGHAGF